MKKKILKVAQKFGYSIKKTSESYSDITNEEFWDIYDLCKLYTMTSIDRMYSLYSAVEYVLKNNIKGDFVECGVWRGGSSMLIAKMLGNRKIFDRKLFLYDTFEGMSAPTDVDVEKSGKTADVLLNENKNDKEGSVWCLADLQDVQNNFKKIDCTNIDIAFVKGKVEDTIPLNIPAAKIALLRLDTDWYESTKHELIHLYPKLETKGVLIIDDYGHWQGCRKAVDEYFQEKGISLLLNRIDYTGRIAIKTSSC
ncbi:MAG: class I SAM-dependent methyltransferase [Bacteroidetes bacterium]|nr:class I SAM-dependent methyltransferase [Bacteroidota bacterium]